MVNPRAHNLGTDGIPQDSKAPVFTLNPILNRAFWFMTDADVDKLKDLGLKLKALRTIGAYSSNLEPAPVSTMLALLQHVSGDFPECTRAG